MGEVDYSRFSKEELQAEIIREQQALTELRTDLAQAEARRADLERATSEEAIAELETRVRLRQQRIERYERSLTELISQIQRFESRIRTRESEIRSIEQAIARNEARLPHLRAVERFITLGTIARLRRSIAILRGWQTRDTEYTSLVRDTYTRNARTLAGLRGWQVREITFLERVDELRAILAETIIEVNRLTTRIATETERLATKRRYIFTLTITVNNLEWGTTTPAPDTYTYMAGATATVTAEPAEGYILDYWQLDDTKVTPHPGLTINIVMDRNHTLTAVFNVFARVVKQLVHAKIIIYSIVRARPPKRYTKRFQAFYNVDAIRDTSTGEIDYSSRLTEKEIDACIDYFYAIWNWATLPSNASEPVWIEAGEWEEIKDPQGADLKQVSVRENEEETYTRRFTPPEVVYSPSKSETEEIMKLLKG